MQKITERHAWEPVSYTDSHHDYIATYKHIYIYYHIWTQSLQTRLLQTYTYDVYDNCYLSPPMYLGAGICHLSQNLNFIFKEGSKYKCTDLLKNHEIEKKAPAKPKLSSRSRLMCEPEVCVTEHGKTFKITFFIKFRSKFRASIYG